MHGSGSVVLLIEDDADVRALVQDALGDRGFVVFEAANGVAARRLLDEAEPPDVAVLDLGLPDISGFDVLADLVARGVPTIILSGRGGELDRVIGLDVGADDYLAKPFSVRELEARLNALLRRSRRRSEGAQLVFEGLTINEGAHEVVVDGRLVALTAREFDLLCFLAEAPRQVFSRSQLLQHVWRSSPRWQNAKTVAEHVHRIRRKLDGEDRERFIETVRGAGYRFAGHRVPRRVTQSVC
ncbi:MAG: response regulator transcription factor [Acidimicrobiia bacterium]